MLVSLLLLQFGRGFVGADENNVTLSVYGDITVINAHKRINQGP